MEPEEITTTENTVSLEQFKKALGKTAEKYTDDELGRISAQMGRLAHALFNPWVTGRGKTNV